MAALRSGSDFFADPRRKRTLLTGASPSSQASAAPQPLAVSPAAVLSSAARVAGRQPLIYFAAATAAGIGLDAWVSPPQWFWVIIFLVAAGVTLNAGPKLRCVAVVCLMVPVAATRHTQSDRAFASASVLQLATLEETPCVTEGRVAGIPRLRRHPLADQRRQRGRSGWQTQLTVALAGIRDGQTFRPVRGRVLVSVDGRCDELNPGDTVRVYGELSRFARPTNPGDVDLREVYRRRGLHARINVDSVDQIRRVEASRWHPGRLVAGIGRHARDALLGQTDDSTGPLAVALVIGQRDFVRPQTRDLLLVTGTAHLLSVSGMHLGIIVILAAWLATAARAPRGVKLVWILGVSVLYVAITGGRPPVVRAAILVALVTLAIVLRRPGQTLNALALAGIGLLIANPEYLFGIGMQLSFLAVATLLIGGRQSTSADAVATQQRQLDRLIDESTGRLARWARVGAGTIVRMVWFSGCVTAVSLPLVWHQFHVVSLISVVTNVILAPMMFVALASGVATVLAAWLPGPLVVIPGVVCHGSLWLMRETIRMAADVPCGHFWLPSPPAWWVIVFYVVLLATLLPSATLAIRVRPRWTRLRSVADRVGRSGVRGGWIVFWAVAAWWLATTPAELPDGSVEATFVDVGHGTSVVIRTDRYEAWLYDCGRLGNDDGSSRHIDATLWSLGLTRLRGIIISHADADHFNALPGVLRRFAADRILTAPGVLAESEPALAAAREAVRKHGVPIEELSAGDSIATAAEPWAVLHPPRRRVEGSDNANSLVIRVDAGGPPLTLPGDIEPPGTALLIRQPRPRPGGVLMAPHHGSLAMDAETVLRWARPRETVVSGGSRAGRPEVIRVLSATGSGVHATPRDGAIRVRLGREGPVEVRSWLASPW